MLAARFGLVLLSCSACAHAQVPENWVRPVPPVRIIGPVFYVGSEELSAFLITSSAGHILVDSGHQQNAEAVARSIRALGFDVKDVRILLSTQAHLDHVGAHARLKQMTGARVLASAADARLMEAGGKGDYILGPEYWFPPVKVDGFVTDGDVVRVGDVALTAHLTPGHTKGSTTWTMKVRDPEGTERALAIVASTSVLEGVNLVNNERYPAIASDFQQTFQVLESLPCEVFLAAHVSAFGGLEKQSYVDPLACRAAIAASRQRFEATLAAQRGAAAGKPRSER